MHMLFTCNQILLRLTIMLTLQSESYNFTVNQLLLCAKMQGSRLLVAKYLILLKMSCICIRWFMWARSQKSSIVNEVIYHKN